MNKEREKKRINESQPWHLKKVKLNDDGELEEMSPQVLWKKLRNPEVFRLPGWLFPLPFSRLPVSE